MSFFTQKAQFIKDSVVSPKKISERDFSKSNNDIGGGLDLVYRWCGFINEGLRGLSNLYGGGSLAPNSADVDRLLLYKPLFSIPEIGPIDDNENGLGITYNACYLMGFDLVQYHIFNGGSFNSRLRKNLRALQSGVIKKPQFSINDIAERPGDASALTHLTEILALLAADFESVTVNAPTKPDITFLAPIRGVGPGLI